MIACVASGVVSTTASARFNLTLNGESMSRIVIGPGLYLSGAIAIIAAVSANELLLRWLGSWAGTTRTLGLLTYPLYLVHSELGERLMRTAADLGGWSALTLSLTVVLFVSAFVLRLERYPRRLIQKCAGFRFVRRRPMGDLP